MISLPVDKIGSRIFEVNDRQTMILDDRKFYEQTTPTVNGQSKSLLQNKTGNNVGEITGDLYKLDKIDHGMPMRSNYTTKKTGTKMNSDDLAYNRNVDFEIFDNDKPIKSSVSYSDPGVDKVFDLNNFQDVTISKKSSPTDITTNLINEYNF